MNKETKWIKGFGKMLKNERLARGMSRTKLAKRSFVDRCTIEEIEEGIITNPDFYDMLKICDVLESSVFYYLEQ